MLYTRLESVCSKFSEEELQEMENQIYRLEQGFYIRWQHVRFELDMLLRELKKNPAVHLELFVEVSVLQTKIGFEPAYLSEDTIAMLLMIKLKYGFETALYGSYHYAKRKMEDDQKLLQKVNVYLDNYKPSYLRRCEEAIYKDRYRCQRVVYEIERMKKLFRGDFYVCREIRAWENLLKKAYYDSDVVNDVYSSILTFQLKNNIQIRLYSGLSELKKRLEMFS